MNIYDFTVKAQDGSEVALSQFAGKAIVPFCTSGGSGMEGSVARITELTAGKATVTSGVRIGADASAEEVIGLICK